MKTFLDQIRNSIAIDKEMIEILPKNGIKQQRELKNKILEVKGKYEKIQGNLYKEINLRYNKIDRIQENPKIQETYEKIKNLNKIETNNSEKRSFEKMELDRLFYDINGYYKKDLSETNKDIFECIQKFKKVGIKITSEDFNVSEYASEYIKILLEEADKGKLNSTRIKEEFDRIYWKCSDLMYHILICIRIIYDEHEKEIDEYFKSKSNSTNNSSEELTQKRIKLDEQYNELLSKDARNILDSFINEENLIGDFKQKSYDEFYIKLVDKTRNQLEDNEKQEVEENLNKLYKNLVEYSKYLEYKFISDEILKIKSSLEKDETANNNKEEKPGKKGKESKKWEKIEEEIKKKKDEIHKLNAKAKGEKSIGKLFKKKVEESTEKEKKEIDVEINKKILELKDLYISFDNAILEKFIMSKLDKTATIYDILKVSTYYYGFLAKCLIKQNSEILAKEVSEEIAKIKKFINEFNFSVINNINIDEKKNISVIIKDRFKLMGFNLTNDDINDNTVEDITRQINVILTTNNIEDSEISIKDIDFYLKAREILKK